MRVAVVDRWISHWEAVQDCEVMAIFPESSYETPVPWPTAYAQSCSLPSTRPSLGSQKPLQSRQVLQLLIQMT